MMFWVYGLKKKKFFTVKGLEKKKKKKKALPICDNEVNSSVRNITWYIYIVYIPAYIPLFCLRGGERLPHRASAFHL